jgi:hypothetical protein
MRRVLLLILLPPQQEIELTLGEARIFEVE